MKKCFVFVLLFCPMIQAMENDLHNMFPQFVAWEKCLKIVVYAGEGLFLNTFFPQNSELLERVGYLAIPSIFDLILVLSEEQQKQVRIVSTMFLLSNELYIGANLATNIYQEGFSSERTRLLSNLLLINSIKTWSTVVPQFLFNCF